MTSDRAEHEIQHGKVLASLGPEQTWGWGSPAGQVRAKRRANFIATGARLNPGSHVLEIGCGTGLFTEYFSETGCFITGVDISEPLIKLAQERHLPAERVRFITKSFEDSDLDGPFDAVIGSSVLHHLDLPRALPRIYQILKPGGILAFAEPNMLNPQVFMERKFRFLFPYVSPDETAFVRWKIKSDLQRLGFQEVEIRPFDWLHPAVPARLIPLASAIGGGLERIPLIREFSGSLFIKAVHP
jgi:2-polyprenyl-3-methyl-5-hydroxy-6-metoxy-1,4-benzoquinol methylase